MDSALNGLAAPTEMEILKKLEDEHLRLQRQVRTIQADRSGIMGVHPQFRRQNQQLKLLKSEYVELNKNLKIAKSGAHKKKDKRMTLDLKRFLLRRMKTLKESEGGVRLMEELDGLLQRNNKNVLQLRKLVTVKAGKLEERRLESLSRLVSMENKLETATLTFNEVQNENKNIRQDIEHMLKDRAVFNRSWLKMLKSLSKGKKYLSDLFEQSTLAYDQRDECCGKLRSMQEKGKVDQMMQMQEMRDLQKVLDHDSRLHDFLARKSVMRINKRQERKDEELKRLKEEELQDEIDANKKILSEIHDYTREYDIQRIIDDFESREVYNFSLYNLLTEVCAETEVLSRNVKKIRREIVDRCDWNEAKISNNNETLEKLKEELNEQIERNESLRSEIAKHDEDLKRTEENVEDIFKILDCSLQPFENLLGDKKPSLTLLNLTFTLINEKIRTMLNCVYFSERTGQKKKADGVKSRLKKYIINSHPPECWERTPFNLLVPADPCPQCIEGRWLSRIVDKQETPFVGDMAMEAVKSLSEESAYDKIDRIHPLTECRLPRSRMILARRYI